MLKILARNPLFSLFSIETNTPMNIIKFSAGGLFQTGKVFDCRSSLFLRHREKIRDFLRGGHEKLFCFKGCQGYIVTSRVWSIKMISDSIIRLEHMYISPVEDLRNYMWL